MADLGILSIVIPSSSLGRISVVASLALGYVAWRVRVAPPSPPPPPPRQPWERTYGTATILAVQGNQFGTISYAYGDASTGECAVVDASGHAAYLAKELKKRGLLVTALVQTHGHLDHVQALPDYLAAHALLPAPRVHPGDAAMLRTYGLPMPKWGPLRLPFVAKMVAAVLAWILGMTREAMPETVALFDGERIDVGANALEVIHVPGHTRGSVCFYDEANKIMFSGDFLMKGTVGRVDLPEGDEAAMANSLRRVATTIPDDVVVLSGHTDPTTMGAEKRLNPHLRWLNPLRVGRNGYAGIR